MKLDKPILDRIQALKDKPPVRIAQYLREEFNVSLNAAKIRSILTTSGSPEATRTQSNIAKATESASDQLAERINRLKIIEDDLMQQYEVATKTADKLRIARELRQWLREGIDAVELKGSDNQVFIFSSEWDINQANEDSSTT